MRKHDVRKWLHAVLDLLPVLLIPVFMIYSHRHTIDSSSIEVSQKLVVNVNQQVSDVMYSVRGWGASGGASVYEEDKISYTSYTSAYPQISYGLQLDTTHYYLYSISVFVDDVSNFRHYSVGNTTLGYISYSLDGHTGTCYRVFQGVGSTFLAYINFTSQSVGSSNDFYFTNPLAIDLTQYFGSNDKIPQSIFDTPSSILDYGVSYEMNKVGTYALTTNPVSVVYNDTDIMSQMTYQLYNSVDKYFNMGDVFGMNGVYEWFNLNIFHANAPLYIYIVWQVVLYEFVMDLLFLLYGLFMWFIDMCEHLMEKPFKSIK